MMKKIKKILNPDYDPEVLYIPRSKRDEWNVVGLLGQLIILIGQVVNPNWIKMKNINHKVDLYLIK